MEEKTHDEQGDQFDNEKDEDYGLPDVSYEPVNREEVREPIIMNPREQQAKNNNDSSWPLILGIIVVVALAGIFIYLFVIKEPEQPPVVEKAPPVEEIPAQEEFITEVDDSAWNTTPVDLEPAAPSIGSMVDISSRTGRAYVVVGSFIDMDLAHDYGNKLASEGVSTVVIAPYGKVKYYRLAVADYPTFGDALANLDHHKAKYGDNIWVLKY